MGSCFYYLRVTFPTALTAEKVKSLTDFFVQAAEAEDEEYELGVKTTFKALAKKYPAINHPEIEKVWDDLRISGQISVQGEALGVKEGTTVLRYGNEVSHMADWGPLCDVMKEVFGASHAIWTSDESDGVDPGSVLDLQIFDDIVEKILNQPKNSLPTFLGIHPALDGMIADKLSNKE